MRRSPHEEISGFPWLYKGISQLKSGWSGPSWTAYQPYYPWYIYRWLLWCPFCLTWVSIWKGNWVWWKIEEGEREKGKKEGRNSQRKSFYRLQIKIPARYTQSQLQIKFPAKMQLSLIPSIRRFLKKAQSPTITVVGLQTMHAVVRSRGLRQSYSSISCILCDWQHWQDDWRTTLTD